MSKTKIEWVQGPDGMIGETWNPTVGCSKISPGCKNCYAIRHVHRMAGNPNPKIRAANEGLTVIQGGDPNWTGKVRLIPERLEIPLRRRKPTTYFVNSLSDLFHETLDDDSILEVFRVMQDCPQHRFQVLTKRADNMRRFMAEWEGESIWDGPPENVWLGVSVESNDYLHRIDDLRRTPAAVRFLSLEPLIENLGTLNFEGIHWVIAGGESGKGARPVHPDWVTNIRDQCVAAGISFFWKQWGAFGPITHDDRHGVFGDHVTHWVSREDATVVSAKDGPREWDWPMVRVGRKAAGRLLDGREWSEMP